MAAGFRSVQLDDRAVDRLLHARGGPVHRTMTAIGSSVTRTAKTLADQRLNSTTTAQFRDGTRSGRYRDRFRTSTGRTPAGLRTRISNDRSYATFLERGTPPHVIRPRKPGGMLVFKSSTGQTVFARQVQHPGTPAFRIMEDALRIGVRKALARGGR